VQPAQFLADAAPEPGDQDLATIGCRRPVFEAKLRRAVQAEPAIDVRAGCRVASLTLSCDHPRHVEGVVMASGKPWPPTWSWTPPAEPAAPRPG
jgi:hypothetical protein